jgi:putative membrane protein
MPSDARTRREPLVLLVLGLLALVVSGIGPKDRATWWLEVFPVIGAALLLSFTFRRFPLTPLAYRLIFVHALILVVGGHWTYAEVPLGEWVRERFGMARNPYDRLGHLAQGFVPAMVAREVLVRCTGLRLGWRFFVVTSVVLAISASYELLEWATALCFGAGATAFLGTQGDAWDTQWDMFLALVGAVAAQALLARRHDRELARLAGVEGEVCFSPRSSGPPR